MFLKIKLHWLYPHYLGAVAQPEVAKGNSVLPWPKLSHLNKFNFKIQVFKLVLVLTSLKRGAERAGQINFLNWLPNCNNLVTGTSNGSKNVQHVIQLG